MASSQEMISLGQVIAVAIAQSLAPALDTLGQHNFQTAQMVASSFGAGVSPAFQGACDQDGDVGGQSKKVHFETLENLIKRAEAFKGVGWADWRFQAGVALKTSLPDVYKLVLYAEAQTSDIDSLDFSDVDESQDRALYFFLVAVMKGEALSIVRNVHDQCGTEAWRRIAKRFGEPRATSPPDAPMHGARNYQETRRRPPFALSVGSRTRGSSSRTTERKCPTA